MEFFINVLIAALLILFAWVVLVCFFRLKIAGENQHLNKLMKPIELTDLEAAKAELEYHLNWAMHSGDSYRAKQLQSELILMDLKLSEMKI